MQDFGNTWANVTENSNGRIASFVDFDWGVNLKPWNPEEKAPPPDKTIFATAYEDPKHMKVIETVQAQSSPSGQGTLPHYLQICDIEQRQSHAAK